MLCNLAQVEHLFFRRLNLNIVITSCFKSILISLCPFSAAYQVQGCWESWSLSQLSRGGRGRHYVGGHINMSAADSDVVIQASGWWIHYVVFHLYFRGCVYKKRTNDPIFLLPCLLVGPFLSITLKHCKYIYSTVKFPWWF